MKHQTVTKDEIIACSLRFTSRQEMEDYLEERTGTRLSAAAFNALMEKSLPKESYYQRIIMNAIRNSYDEYGCFAWKAAAGPYSRQGIPDICAIINGRFFGLEVKRPFIGKPTAIQEETIHEINNAGGHAAVVHNLVEARSFITERMFLETHFANMLMHHPPTEADQEEGEPGE